jgi:hypothetical protein
VVPLLVELEGALDADLAAAAFRQVLDRQRSCRRPSRWSTTRARAARPADFGREPRLT